MLGWTLASTLISGVARPAEAQIADVSRVSLGDSVRVKLPRALRVNASLVAWRGDVMMLDMVGLEEPWPVAMSDLESLEAYLARTSREGFRYGAVLGAVAGIFAGAAVGLALHSAGVVDGPDRPADQIMVTALKWAGLGAAGGGIVGGFYWGAHPGFGWIQIALPGS